MQRGEHPEARVEWEGTITGRIFEAILLPTEFQGQPAVAAYLRDVSQRHRLARELAATVDDLDLYRQIFELGRDSVVLVQDGVIQLSNGALRGSARTSITGRRVDDLFDSDTVVSLRQDAQRIFAGELDEAVWEWPVPGAPSEPTRTIEAIARRIDYRGRAALLINTRDVTERKAVEVRLQEMSRTDALTGIPNRRAFYEALAYWRDESRRSKSHHAVCYIDLDGFKLVNDTHGHSAGDDVLVEIARRFRETVRRTDILARLGGDEFAVLLPATGEAGAVEVADKLLADVHAAAAIHPVPAGKSGVSASIGVTTFGAEDEPDEVMSRADREMYRIKMERRAKAS